jgi:hypothetical protein
LFPEINVFLFTLISQAEQELERSTKHGPYFREDISDNLGCLFDFACLQKHDIDPRRFDLPGGLKDLFLTQFKDRVPTRVIAPHRAELAVDPAKIRNLHQPADDDTIAERGLPCVPGGGKESLLKIILRLKPSR